MLLLHYIITYLLFVNIIYIYIINKCHASQQYLYANPTFSVPPGTTVTECLTKSRGHGDEE